MYNFSSYSLTKEEVAVLTYRLDQHIPNYTDCDTMNTEFELFLQNILNGMSNIPKEALTNIKTKLSFSCKKYYNKRTT